MVKRILVIAPHADDEVLGCGGIINKFAKNGHEVNILIATNASKGAPELYTQAGIDRIRKHAKQAHKILGVHESLFLELPAPSLDTYPIYQSANQIKSIIDRIQPTDLFIPHKGDIHKDHTAIFYATLVAARPINNCPVKNIYAYETLSETEWAPPYSDEYFVPNVYITIEEELSLKIEAMKIFTSQLKEFPHPRSIKTIEALAAFRGATIGSKAAEAFSLIRSINN